MVEVDKVGEILKNIWYRAMFGVDKGFGLGIAIGGDGASAIEHVG